MNLALRKRTAVMMCTSLDRTGVNIPNANLKLSTMKHNRKSQHQTTQYTSHASRTNQVHLSYGTSRVADDTALLDEVGSCGVLSKRQIK